MALKVQQEICVNCGNVVFTESTGTYDATTNLTGYGTPNPVFGAVTPYTAAFTPPGGKEAIFVLDLYADTPAPDADGHYTWTITPVAFGLTTPVGGVVTEARLKSGIWTVRVTFGTVVTDIAVLIYDDIEARICACVCKDVCNIDLWAELQAAKLLFGAFKNKQAQKMIDRLYRDTECCWNCGC